MNASPYIADHPLRILIVDDERHTRDLLEVMLAPHGFILEAVTSGEEALAVVAARPPDLILLDIMMAGMDGFQVVARIKGDVATKNIPIIMITAIDDRSAMIRGLSAGAEDFLTKPVDRVELGARVKNLLRLKSYGDHFDKYSRILESEVLLRTADLVERTKALEQQATVLNEQAALLDLAQDAIVVRDMHGRIVFWSRGAEVMYGWLSNEALGQDAGDLLQTKSSQPREYIEATLLDRGQWQGEAVHHTRDGTLLTVDSRWALQRDADRAPRRILTIDYDISARIKQAAAEMLLLTEREQGRQNQLRFKDEFLSHVSHEFRTPLTAIKQFTTILLDGLAGDLNGEQREYQEIVLKNIRQLQSMIGDLLEVTRLESGKLTVQSERVSIANAITDTFSTLQVTAHAKGVTLTSDLAPGLPAAQADRVRLRQILIILLDNAIKFTRKGGRATIRARRMPDDPHVLLVEVSDTGCGISPESTGRIFERLYQDSMPTHASRKGLGLGLYICKELVTLQGGHIWVESQPAVGSTFSFTLPASSRSRIGPSLDASIDFPIQTEPVRS